MQASTAIKHARANSYITDSINGNNAVMIKTSRGWEESYVGCPSTARAIRRHTIVVEALCLMGYEYDDVIVAKEYAIRRGDDTSVESMISSCITRMAGDAK